MFSIYIACMIGVPILILLNSTLKIEKGSNVLLDKNETKILRGISACFVMIAHYLTYMKDTNTININKFFYAIFSQLGGIGVLIFFFISGYGIYVSYADKTPSWKFVWKRLITIYMPYILMKFIIQVFLYISGLESAFSVSKVLSIVMVEDWFIQVILMQYMIFFLIWNYVGKDYIIKLGFVADIVLTIIFFLQNKSIGWFNALWLFTFGMLCEKYKSKIIDLLKHNLIKKLVLLVLLFCTTGAIFAIYKGAIWANLFKVLSGAILCIAICGVLKLVCLKSKIMMYIGERSMHYYIVHMSVWNMLQKIENVILKFWIAICITIILVEILHRLTENISNKVLRKCSIK